MRFNPALIASVVRRKRIMMSMLGAESPQQAVLTYNSLKNMGGNSGAEKVILMVPKAASPTLQTVNTVTVGSDVPGGQSLTGFLNPFWDNVADPGNNSHFRPDAAYPFGIPCTAEGYIRSIGHFMPAAAAALINLIGPTDDTAAPTTWPNNVLKNRGTGFSLGGVTRLVAGVKPFQLGDDGSPDACFIDGNIMTDVAAFSDPIAGHMPGGGLLSTGSKPMAAQVWHGVIPSLSAFLHNGNIKRRLMGRDLMTTVRPLTDSGNYLAAGRKLYLIRNNGQTVGGNSPGVELRCFWADKGRPNVFQNIYWNNWLEAQQWLPLDYWYDPRSVLIWLMGNSFQQPLDGPDPYSTGTYAEHIIQGIQGLPRVTDTVMVNTAESGRNIAVDQGMFLRFWEDCDFSRRTIVGLLIGEFINNSTLAENYSLADMFRAKVGPKYRGVLYTAIYAEAGGFASRMPAVLNQINATAVQDGHVDYVLNFLAQAGYLPWAFGDGTDGAIDPVNGQKTHLWGGFHPTALASKLSVPMFNIGARQIKGENVGNQGMLIYPDVEHCSINATLLETFTPVWTIKDNLLNTLAAGKTLTFISLDPSIATVDASSGVITGVSAGQVAILARCVQDGSLGVIRADISGAAPPVIPAVDHIWSTAILSHMSQDAAGATPVAATSDPVGRLMDTGSAGTLYHAAFTVGAGATARPLLQLASQNGRPGLLFDAVNDFLAIATAAIPTGPHTVFIVCNPAVAAAFRIVFGCDFNQGDWHIGITGAHKAFYSTVTTAAGKNVAGTVTADGAPVVLEGTYDLTNMRLRTNGADERVVAQTGNLAPNAADGLAIGAGTLLPSGAFEFYGGLFYEILLFNQALSQAQRDLVNTQLRGSAQVNGYGGWNF